MSLGASTPENREPGNVFWHFFTVTCFLALIFAATAAGLLLGLKPYDFAVITMLAFGLVILAYAGVVLLMILNGQVPLSGLLSEPDKVAKVGAHAKASLSRFQFLIFTFVIAGLFLMLSIEAGGFVVVPDSVLYLMGLSGSGFLISKGVGQANQNKDDEEPPKTDAEKIDEIEKALAGANATIKKLTEDLTLARNAAQTSGDGNG